VVFSGPRVRIGRSRDNSLILTESDAPASSARHAEAVVEGGAWWIVDAGSTNGTFVNGARVDRRPLAVGDRLAFGDDHFIVAAAGRTGWLAAAAIAAMIAVVAAGTLATRRRTPVSREQIAAAAAQSVYAIVLESAGSRSIVGTAFAVGDRVLATNAHVAGALRDAAPPSARAAAIAVRSDTYDQCRVTAITLHPEWKPGSLHADAALLRVDATAPLVPVALAADADFKRLRRGASIVSFGFPAVSTDVQRPRGRLALDIVGDVRGEYVQAGLSIVPGTSGSPVFDDNGAVIAMVAAGDFARGPDGTLAPTGSQANWAISVERVRELLGR
jgi:V8-like Glu-specific endopeptidase